jgi:hypothetical protein
MYNIRRDRLQPLHMLFGHIYYENFYFLTFQVDLIAKFFLYGILYLTVLSADYFLNLHLATEGASCFYFIIYNFTTIMR